MGRVSRTHARTATGCLGIHSAPVPRPHASRALVPILLHMRITPSQVQNSVGWMGYFQTLRGVIFGFESALAGTG